MLKVSQRPYTEEEKERLVARRPTAYQRFESFTMLLIFIEIAFLSPLLIIGKYYPITSKHEAYSSLAITLLSIYTSYKLFIKLEGKNNLSAFLEDINKKQVAVIHVKTTRAIERKDPEDFGAAFYIDIQNQSNCNTLYIQSQYLDELNFDKKFPNTEFVLTLDAESKEILNIETIGQFFEPEKLLAAFDKDTWQSGNHPYSGDFLEETIDEISWGTSTTKSPASS